MVLCSRSPCSLVRGRAGDPSQASPLWAVFSAVTATDSQDSFTSAKLSRASQFPGFPPLPLSAKSAGPTSIQSLHCVHITSKIFCKTLLLSSCMATATVVLSRRFSLLFSHGCPLSVSAPVSSSGTSRDHPTSHLLPLPILPACGLYASSLLCNFLSTLFCFPLP